MKKIPFVSAICVLFSLFLLAACDSLPKSIGLPTPSHTPDLCAPNHIGTEIKKINDLIREFDDITYVANLTDQKLLTQPIIQLQTVRRNTENLNPPSCLLELRKHAVNYMNMVINYLAHFMGGVSQEQINAEINTSQTLRNTYEAERARLVGATFVPPPTQVPVTQPPISEQPQSTTDPNRLEISPTPTTAAEVTNTGEASINIRFEPSMTSAIVGYLQPNSSAPAIGRTADSKWIAIQPANSSFNYAWVYADTVTLSIPIDRLPTPDLSSPEPAETPGS